MIINSEMISQVMAMLVILMGIGMLRYQRSLLSLNLLGGNVLDEVRERSFRVVVEDMENAQLNRRTSIYVEPQSLGRVTDRGPPEVLIE
ncbi:hypothetical protein [Thalassobacillus pellis]|uniref:hypothetical protein n=1 Tax=Thalassobacillus pellis TaxID=748008 RepID=UPI0019614FBA|nr:hypothetical protein [Thalassobacillus pellis]MBM7552029.1 hypothetical protein [Thalassobacillus pellis]